VKTTRRHKHGWSCQSIRCCTSTYCVHTLNTKKHLFQSKQSKHFHQRNWFTKFETSSNKIKLPKHGLNAMVARRKKMSSLWGIILWSTLLYSLKGRSNFSSYLGFILLPLDNTIAQSLFRRSHFKLDTFMEVFSFLFFTKSLDIEIIYFSLVVSFLWVCFAQCNIIVELLFNGCATVLAKCFLQSTMDSEEHIKGNSHPIPFVFSLFMNL